MSDDFEGSLDGNHPPFSTPILIIFWRRPEPVIRLIARLRPLRPTTIFLACDGAREGNGDEFMQVARSRLEVEQAIDWPCSIMKRYSEVNLGVKLGPYNAIDWFFSSVEEGIVFEDDCLPETAFLPFCAATLERFRDDERIWQVTGNNFVPSSVSTDHSYFFSKYPPTWGWASWRRCWNLYDINMTSWPDIRDSGMLANAFDSSQELEYWTALWNCLVDYDYPLTWDYQWIYACVINGALCVVPRCNLVSNIGFGSDGTNCLHDDNALANLPTYPLEVVKHPSAVLRDRAYDQSYLALIVSASGKPPAGLMMRLLLGVYFTAKGLLGKLARS